VPSREEHDQNELDSIGEDDNGAIEYATIVASPLFKPEELTSFEAGYRFVTAKRLSLDVATFYNVYDDLRTLDTRPSVFTASPIAGRMTPLLWTNHGYGRVLGAEVTAFWTVSPILQFSGNYTRLHMQLHAAASDAHEDIHEVEGKNARHLFYARAYADLPQKVALALELRYVGAIPGEEIPSYVEGNLHLSRAVREGLRLNVTLENVLHRRHAEWDGGGLVQSRAVRAGFTWTF
jgi:iron complex outermembrane receptor protein